MILKNVHNSKINDTLPKTITVALLSIFVPNVSADDFILPQPAMMAFFP